MRHQHKDIAEIIMENKNSNGDWYDDSMETLLESLHETTISGESTTDESGYQPG